MAETRIRLTAVDETTRTLNSIRESVKDLTGSFGKLSGTLSAIGVTGALAGITAMVKGAIDAAASMAELSQKTGIAVKEVSALDYAMRREGVSTESFGKAMKTLSQNIVEASDSSSKIGTIFKALGVNIGAGPREAMLKIADAFELLPDGATKAALAVELFGKAGTDLIPALNNGAKGIREIEEEARRLGITFDTETARAAKEFNDKLFALHETSKRLGVTLATEMIDPLNRIAGAMREAAIESGTLKAAWIGLGGVLAEALGLNQTEAEAQKKRIREIGDEILRLAEVKAKDLGGGVFDRAQLIAAQERIKALREELRLIEQLRLAQAGGFDDQASRRARQGQVLPGSGAALAGQINDLLGAKKGVRDARDEIDQFGKQLDALLDRLSSKSLGADAGFIGDMKTLAVAMHTGRLSTVEYTVAMRDLLAQQPVYKAALEAEEKKLKEIAELNATRAKSLQAIVDEIAKEEDANRARGLTRSAIEDITIARLADRIAQIRGTEGAEDEIRLMEEQIKARTRLRNVIKTGEAQEDATKERTKALEEQKRAWDEMGDVASRFFSDLVTNGRDAFTNLRRLIKQTLADMVGLFAKRWILNLAAGGSLLGSAGDALAGGSGAGSLAGSALSGVGSLVGIGGAAAGGFGAAAGAGFSAGLSTLGVAWEAGAAAVGGLGSVAGSVLAVAGPIGAALFAAYALYQAFKDKGENWQATLGFGANAQAYTNNGVFGPEGFASIQGNDALNRQIQAFFASTGVVDSIIAAALSSDTIASITQNLGAAYTTRNNGQPAQFAFGADDQTAGQQLTLEYLQKKYGTVFDQIDKTFADFIRSYTGDSADLLKEIDAFARIFQAISNSGVPGLDINALRDMQRAGESLTDTFNAVAGSMSTYYQEFFSESERRAGALAGLTERFHDLGIEMPNTRTEFRLLVESLDLTTDSGAALWRKLIELAPAFAALVPVIDGIVDLAASAGNALARSGLTANGLGRGTVGAFGFGHVGNAQPEAPGDNNTPDWDNSPIYRRDRENAALGDLAGAARDAAEALGHTKESLGLFLRDLASNPALSPLDPKGQLDSATASFWTDLALARAGDPSASARIQGDLTNALTLGHTNYASGSQYVDLFNTLTTAAGEFANSPSTQTMTLLTTTNLTLAEIHAATLQTNELLERLVDSGHEDAETVAAAVTVATMSTQERR